MQRLLPFDVHQVQEVYSGAEGRLWELVMGEQIHIGGLKSSMDLAEKAVIAPGSAGIDLCCCTGAGMRFLMRFCDADRMMGVDFTEAAIETGRRRCAQEGLAESIRFTLADVRQTGLPGAQADFVWGEDAWCYVPDKPALIAEAVRLTRPGGTIAFTDWITGPEPMSDKESERLLAFMKFPDMESLAGYRGLIERNGCQVLAAEDTGRFARHVDLYLDMLNLQLSYDALKIIGFDMALMQALGGEMEWMRQLAYQGKIAQGLFVARKE